jgi:hypothetical protein
MTLHKTTYPLAQPLATKKTHRPKFSYTFTAILKVFVNLVARGGRAAHALRRKSSYRKSRSGVSAIQAPPSARFGQHNFKEMIPAHLLSSRKWRRAEKFSPVSSRRGPSDRSKR